MIDTPVPGSNADPFTVVDSIELSIAVDGEEEALASATFTSGQTLELPEVPYGENLVIHMVGKFSGTTFAYGRTCRFAIRPGEPPPTPHLYFAREVSWATGAFPIGDVRIGGAALTHHDGSALFVGGHDASNVPVQTIDRFDAATGTFVDVTGVTARENGAVAALGDGRVVIAGGLDHATGEASTSLEIVSVDQNRVEPISAGPLITSATPALATLSDGRVVAFGGLDAAGVPLAQVVDINGVTAGITLRVLQRAQLATPRHGHVATRISEDLGAPVLITGGVDAANTAIKSAELFKPLVELMDDTFTAPMITERRDHQIVRLPDGSLLVVGGTTAAGAPVAALEVFSLGGGFQSVGTLPPDAGVTQQTLTTLPDGRILFAGGRDINGNPVAASFIADLDPVNGTVDIVTTDPLSEPRTGHQATALCDGTIMLVGGTDRPSTAERYNPTAAGRR